MQRRSLRSVQFIKLLFFHQRCMSIFANSLKIMLVTGAVVWVSGAHALSVRPVDGESLVGQRVARMSAQGKPSSMDAESQVPAAPKGLPIHNGSSPILGAMDDELSPTLALSAAPSMSYPTNVAPPLFALNASAHVGQNNMSHRFQHTLPAGQQPVLQIANDNEDLNVVSAKVSAVPLPGAIWMFGTALLGFIGFSSRRRV